MSSQVSSPSRPMTSSSQSLSSLPRQSEIRKHHFGNFHSEKCSSKSDFRHTFEGKNWNSIFYLLGFKFLKKLVEVSINVIWRIRSYQFRRQKTSKSVKASKSDLKRINQAVIWSAHKKIGCHFNRLFRKLKKWFPFLIKWKKTAIFKVFLQRCIRTNKGRCTSLKMY